MPEKQHFPDETLAYRLISEKVVKSESIKIQIWIFLSSPLFYTFSSFPENMIIGGRTEEEAKKRLKTNNKFFITQWMLGLCAGPTRWFSKSKAALWWDGKRSRKERKQ